MRMPYWEYEMTIKECEALAEEEKKQQEEQEGKYKPPSMGQYQKQSQNMMRGAGGMPSMPSMPKMPKL